MCSCSACFAVQLHEVERLQVLQGVPGGKKGEGEGLLLVAASDSSWCEAQELHGSEMLCDNSSATLQCHILE